MAIVRLTQVGKSYNGLTAMDDISLEIPSGHFLTLLGPSGCGKTTTLRSIAGLVQVDQGQITIDGQDVTHLPPHERDLSIVFQSHALFPHLTVIDNVAFGLRMKGVHKNSRRTSAQEMLNLVGLDSMSGRFPVWSKYSSEPISRKTPAFWLPLPNQSTQVKPKSH